MQVPSGLRVGKRIAVGVVGSVLLAAGVAMIVLPGPSLPVILGGLAVLGLEYPWARRWQVQVTERVRRPLVTRAWRWGRARGAAAPEPEDRAPQGD